jgi:hypothetical protein
MTIKTIRAPKRRDGLSTYIRSVTADQLPCKEITGFIDCSEFIAFFVMFTPEQLESRNIRKLVHTLMYSIPSKIKFDNTKVIEQMKDRYQRISKPQEKSDALRQIADWYSEMECQEEAMNYRRLSFDAFPENYENIRPLISGELKLSQWESAIKYSLTFFSMDTANPRVMQDILTIYDTPACKETFDKLITKLETLYANKSEALGNIQFHYGMYLLNNGNNKLATEYFRSARNTFESFDKRHYVIAQIDDVLKD